MQHTPSPSEKSWIERLAAESWQAELVISGIAIFGSFQLFPVVNDLIDWMYFVIPESLTQVAYFLCFYQIIGVLVLSGSFLVHFAVRAVWIASIGLESVYPEGIKRDNEVYSPHFMDQVLDKFPSFHAFNEALDNFASAILAYALMFVMAFAGIGLLLSLLLFVGFMLATFWNETGAYWVVIGAIGVITVSMFVVSALNSKTLRDRPWVQRIHFPLTYYFNIRVFGNVFYRPQNYMMFTVRTNMATQNFWKLMTVFFVLIFIASGFFAMRSNLMHLQHNVFVDADERTDRLYAGNYEDQAATSDLAYIRPLLPSQTLRYTSEFQLFLPMPNREEWRILERCSLTEPDIDPSDPSTSAARRDYLLACFREQIDLFVDEQKVDFVVKVATHPHKNEPGLQYFFPNLKLETGEHLLRIVHKAVPDGDGFKTDNVPFFYLPN